MNRNNKLLATLATEQDILDRIVTALDTASVRALEKTCRRSKAIFKQFSVWERYVERLMDEKGLVYDWERRMGQDDYEEILTSLENLELMWSPGPVRTSSISVEEEVVDIAMDEADIAVATTAGNIILYSRLSNTEVLSTGTESADNINKLGLSQACIVSGHCSK